MVKIYTLKANGNHSETIPYGIAYTYIGHIRSTPPPLYCWRLTFDGLASLGGGEI